MFFCPHCNNSLDITRSDTSSKIGKMDKMDEIDSIVEESSKSKDVQEGGAINKNMALFECTNCGFSKKIEPGTKIFSRISSDVSKDYTSNTYNELLNSDILPRTRKYNCPNKECRTYTDPTIKEAIFQRRNNSYKLVYVCTVCKTVF